MKFDSLEAFKKHFPIVVEIPVAWGEMDSMQHVNHTVYLKWMETARFEFFEKVGMMEFMQESGVGNISSLRCRDEVFGRTIRGLGSRCDVQITSLRG